MAPRRRNGIIAWSTTRTDWKPEEKPGKYAKSLLDCARHWLRVLEEYPDARQADLKCFVETSCPESKFKSDTHHRSVRLEPQGKKVRKTHLTCIASAADIPGDLLEEAVIQPLQADGFEIGELDFHLCGCTTFTVMPHELADDR